MKLLLNEDEAKFLKDLLDWTIKNAKSEENKKTCLRIYQRIDLEPQPGYLDGISDKAKEFFDEVYATYHLNMYHSLAAIIKQTKKYPTPQACFDGYYRKYKGKRPYIIGKEKVIRELIDHISKRILKY